MLLPVPSRDGKGRTALRHLDSEAYLHGKGTSCVQKLSEAPINPYLNGQDKASEPDHHVHHGQVARLQGPKYRKDRRLLTRKLFFSLLTDATFSSLHVAGAYKYSAQIYRWQNKYF
jgi:hypothetical protein